NQLFFKGPFYSPHGTKRGLLTVILGVLKSVRLIRNIFVMGTSHSIDMSALVESSIAKELGWLKPQVISILPHHFIKTKSDLEKVLRSMFRDYGDGANDATRTAESIDQLTAVEGDYIDYAMGDPRIDKILP